MNAEQRSVTAAFALVLTGLAVRHHWPSRLAAWVGRPPEKPGKPAPIIPAGQLLDWQAAIIAYAVLMLLGETSAAPVAPALAWAVGLVMLFAATGELRAEYPSLFGDAPAPQQQAQPVGGQNVGPAVPDTTHA